MRRGGQISLEFIIIFGLFTILLLYSIRNTSFSEGTPSVETLKIQTALEEKNLANTISNTISQVYAQGGPGSKATSYVKLVYLRNPPSYLERAWNVENPKIFITYGHLQGGPSDNGTYVMVINGTETTNVALSGDNKNIFWSRSLYAVNLLGNSAVWNSTFGNSTQIKLEGGSSTSTTVYGLVIPPPRRCLPI
ncbi:class III signal peptide-containing protein [Thermococcus peptonophilus]|uniref:class III signal peptide-containing protein n=1 Tax=Thermococcus peptonophilus TaxID=53952 RepID=UPI000A541905